MIIEVGCAIIGKEGKLLIAQRKPADHLGGYWEFPGGKREANETMEQCLKREVLEELGVLIRPRQFIRRRDCEYPARKISLHFYFCDWVKGEPERLDCLDFRWVTPEELRNFRFPPADDEMIDELIRKKEAYFGF